MKKTLSRVTAVCLAASFMTGWAAPVFAQAKEEAAKQAPESGAWMAFVLALFFLIAVVIGCFTSPKRSHLD